MHTLFGFFPVFPLTSLFCCRIHFKLLLDKKGSWVVGLLLQLLSHSFFPWPSWPQKYKQLRLNSFFFLPFILISLPNTVVGKFLSQYLWNRMFCQRENGRKSTYSFRNLEINSKTGKHWVLFEWQLWHQKFKINWSNYFGHCSKSKHSSTAHTACR